jgi:hypothetical protein
MRCKKNLRLFLNNCSLIIHSISNFVQEITYKNRRNNINYYGLTFKVSANILKSRHSEQEDKSEKVERVDGKIPFRG